MYVPVDISSIFFVYHNFQKPKRSGHMTYSSLISKFANSDWTKTWDQGNLFMGIVNWLNVPYRAQNSFSDISFLYFN